MGIGIVLVILLLALLLGRKLFELSPSLASLPFGLAMVTMAGMAAVFAYWTYGCFSLRYELRGNQLRIVWGLSRLFIPLGQIESVVMGSKIMERPQVAGVSWPGYVVGQGWTTRTGPVLYLATSQASIDLIYLVTPQGTYAISVPNQGRFVQQLEARLKESTNRVAPVTLESPSPLKLETLDDRFLLIMAQVGALLNLGLWVHTLYAFPNLPPLLALHFDILGRVDRIGFREDLLRFPLAALGILLINTALATILRQREVLASRLVMGLAVLIQVIIWVALNQVVTY